MAKDPAFLFYSADFLTGTMFMSKEEVGIYVYLLCAQHQHGGFINKRDFENVVGDHMFVRDKFKQSKKGYFNTRLKEEMDRRSFYTESRRANAKHKKSTCKAYASHMETETVNENIKEQFNILYNKYPKKVGKKEAFRHYKVSVKTDEDIKRIVIALDHYVNSKRVAKGFIQNASTFFNQWQDWVDFEEPICRKCNGKGFFISATNFEIKCDCEDGKNRK